MRWIRRASRNCRRSAWRCANFRASGKRVIAAGRLLQSDPVLPGGAGRRGVPRSRWARCPCTASAITACTTRTRSTSSASIPTCFAPAPSRAIPINSRATTWRRASARRLPRGSSPCGTPTVRMSRAPARCPPPRSRISSPTTRIAAGRQRRYGENGFAAWVW